VQFGLAQYSNTPNTPTLRHSAAAGFEDEDEDEDERRTPNAKRLVTETQDA
jgi:hypothetical protein